MKKKIVILGAGESGTGAALLAKSKGFDVFLSDNGIIKQKYKDILLEESIEFEENIHTISKILEADEIIKSPVISEKTKVIQTIKEANINIISEIEFANRYTKAKKIAITGSNGKTTTTLLTFHILKSAGLNVGLAGNVGESFAKQVIDDTFDYFVLELSSFQLDDMYDFKADIGILLNITSDHLDRYEKSFENYKNSKFRILRNMGLDDSFIYYADSKVITDELEVNNYNTAFLPISLEHHSKEGGYFDGKSLISKTNNSYFEILAEDLPVKGPHNIIDTLAAILIAQKLGLTDASIRNGLVTFRNVSHRLEQVRILNNVLFVNDSKATNVDAVYYALKSYTPPIILIIGGVDKGNDYTQIEALVKEKVKLIIYLGKDNNKLKSFFQDFGIRTIETMEMREAVNKSWEFSSPGDVVLLAPACSSFDLFINYEDRGNQFKEAVSNLV